MDSYQGLFTQFATAKLGWTLVTIYPDYKERKLPKCVNLVDLSTLIRDQRFKSFNYIRVLLNVSPGLLASANLFSSVHRVVLISGGSVAIGYHWPINFGVCVT